MKIRGKPDNNKGRPSSVSVMMTSEPDFLKWEDLPVDFFLGEFTDDEGENPESDCDDVVVEERSKVTKVSRFLCPRCAKTYSSISGFRGHVLKTHDEPQLKANDHRFNQPASGSVGLPESLSGDMSDGDICEVVKAAIKIAVKDPTFNSEHMAEERMCFETIGEKLLTCKDKVDILSKCLSPMTCAVGNALKAGAHERMWRVFHEMGSHELVERLMSIIVGTADSVSRNIVFMFARYLLDALVEALVQREKKCEDKTIDAAMETVSESDQGVLYYMAGNLLYSMRKKTKVQETRDMVQAMCALESDPDEPSYITAWLKAKDRGGLKKPSKKFFKPSMKFFKLMLMFESSVRKVVDLETLGATSLSTVRLKETIISDRSVQMAWQDIIQFPGHQILLENFVSFFLTVRDFAIAKDLKRQEQQQKCKEDKQLKKRKHDNVRNGSSMRKKLTQ